MVQITEFIQIFGYASLGGIVSWLAAKTYDWFTRKQAFKRELRREFFNKKLDTSIHLIGNYSQLSSLFSNYIALLQSDDKIEDKNILEQSENVILNKIRSLTDNNGLEGAALLFFDRKSHSFEKSISASRDVYEIYGDGKYDIQRAIDFYTNLKKETDSTINYIRNEMKKYE